LLLNGFITLLHRGLCNKNISYTICSLYKGPLGASFFNSMNRMASNMNAMATNLQIQGQQMALNRQQSIEADMLRSWEGAPFMTGGSVFITADGGLGYAYK
jgi:hypothetical protein